jgi:predicted phage terminase large subunit-like protein
MFKREWFEILLAAPRCTRVVRYWDKAGTKGGNGAETAGVKLGLTPDNQFIVLDVVHDRLAASEREALIKLTAQLDGPTVQVWVEQEPGSGGKESAEATVKNLIGFSCQIERVTGSKEVRAEPLQAQASVRNVKLLQAEWNASLLDELTVFPVGRLKDMCDALSGALNKLAVGTGAFGLSSELQAPSLHASFSEEASFHEASGEDTFFS